MATLAEPLWPDVEYEDVIINGRNYGPQPVDWQAEVSWMDDQLANQPTGTTEGRYIAFPMGDGKAFYRIESTDPLVLRPVLFGDCWAIPDAHLRGLNLDDVTAMVEQDRRWRELAAARS